MELFFAIENWKQDCGFADIIPTERPLDTSDAAFHSTVVCHKRDNQMQLRKSLQNPARVFFFLQLLL